MWLELQELVQAPTRARGLCVRAPQAQGEMHARQPKKASS